MRYALAVLLLLASLAAAETLTWNGQAKTLDWQTGAGCIAGQACVFQISGIDGLSSMRWEMGDGKTFVLDKPRAGWAGTASKYGFYYTFHAAGDYSVTVTVASDAGLVYKTSLQVVVSDKDGLQQLDAANGVELPRVAFQSEDGTIDPVMVGAALLVIIAVSLGGFIVFKGKG